MTKAVTENTGVVLRASAIVGALVLLGVWFNGRLSAVETKTSEVSKDIQYTQAAVLEMKDDIKKVLSRLPPLP